MKSIIVSLNLVLDPVDCVIKGSVHDTLKSVGLASSLHVTRLNMTSMTSFLPTSLLVLVLLLGLCFCEANFDAQGLNQSNSKDDAIFHTSRRTVRNVNYSTSSAENSRKFRLNYTLLTANSPDCKPSLSDSFPVLVQYRMMLSGESSYDNSSTLREWLDFSSASASSLGNYNIIAITV